ncbi:hypothetical protein NLG97_g5740 [Lecanicillium saksenae]|uniref:Uncharacterized protein n=1 Tax=Lecanicillium saksenae TaxID=468837 RepID=A0ACC1QRM0_9HYPO|nr:hypothetical protein NLG97_g5740 [Lecanicillium saksenae]
MVCISGRTLRPATSGSQDGNTHTCTHARVDGWWWWYVENDSNAHGTQGTTMGRAASGFGRKKKSAAQNQPEQGFDVSSGKDVYLVGEREEWEKEALVKRRYQGRMSGAVTSKREGEGDGKPILKDLIQGYEEPM